MQLKSVPDLKEQIGLQQRAGMANELRIFRGYARRISNFLKLQRYEEAEMDAARMTGIFRAWSLQRERNLQSCQKSSARELIKK